MLAEAAACAQALPGARAIHNSAAAKDRNPVLKLIRRIFSLKPPGLLGKYSIQQADECQCPSAPFLPFGLSGEFGLAMEGGLRKPPERVCAAGGRAIILATSAAAGGR